MRDLPDKKYFRVEPAEEKRNSIYSLNGKKVKPTYVKHLGRLRIPTLFPRLLQEICGIERIQLVDFISSNPWDFSDELIRVMKKNPKIIRQIHLPVQAGDNAVLHRMNRWYTREEYLTLVRKLKEAMPEITLSTDIIVGFCGETKEQFEQTVALAKEVGFSKAYVAMYSDRPMTAAHKAYTDDVPREEKKRRWRVLEELINLTNLRKGTYVKSIRYA
jgi:tRNA-2-methylthio-N6-dimethylallyladenosine synthase